MAYFTSGPHPEERYPLTDSKCLKCDGCGKVADSADEEPWTDWTNLPLHSSAAILNILGLLKSKPCPSCNGLGSRSS